jgi:WD40 repeat protein/uncharacterized caspase-like protein
MYRGFKLSILWYALACLAGCKSLLLPTLVTDQGFPKGGRYAVAVSEDDTRAFTTAANSAILWDLRTGREIRRFIGGSATVLSADVDWAHDRVATGDNDGTVRLWSLLTGKELGNYRSHLKRTDQSILIRAIAFTSDAQNILAVSASDATTSRIERWNIETRSYTDWKDLPEDVIEAGISRGGGRVVVGLRDSRVLSFDTHTRDGGAVAFDGQATKTSGRGVSKLSIDPTGASAVVVRTDDGQSGVYDAVTGHLRWPFPQYAELHVHFAAFDYSGKRLLVGTEERVSNVDPEIAKKLLGKVDAIKAKEAAQGIQRQSYTLSGAIEADKGPKVTGDALIGIFYDVYTGERQDLRLKLGETLRASLMYDVQSTDGLLLSDLAAYSPSGQTVLVSGDVVDARQLQGTVLVFDTKEGLVRQRLGSSVLPISVLAIRADGDSIVVGAEGAERLIEWDLREGRPGSGYGPITENLAHQGGLNADGNYMHLQFVGESDSLFFQDQTAFHLWSSGERKQTYLGRNYTNGRYVAVSDDLQFGVVDLGWSKVGEGYVENFALWNPSADQSLNMSIAIPGEPSFSTSFGPEPSHLSSDRRYLFGERDGDLCRMSLYTPHLKCAGFPNMLNASNIPPPFSIAGSGATILTGDPRGGATYWLIGPERSAFLQSVYRFQAEGSVTAITLSKDGRDALLGTDLGVIQDWRLMTNPGDRSAPPRWHSSWSVLAHEADISAMEISSRHGYIATGSLDGSVKLIEKTSGKTIATLYVSPGGDWAVVDPTGRFDTGNLDNISWFHWMFTDGPYQVLSPEIYFRDYYEPRLLPRLMFGSESFSKLRPLSNLNRAQPKIRRIEVSEPRADATVDVTIELESGEYTASASGKRWVSAPYDLRLFRDGQLIGEAPSSQQERSEGGQNSDRTLEQWRYLAQLTPDRDARISIREGIITVLFSSIRIPHAADGKVEFSAYAFNEDRVKGETRKTTSPSASGAPTPKAYVLAIGVDDYGNERWNLRFAAKDAGVIAEFLVPKLKQAGYEPKIRLLQTGEGFGRQASKEAIREAFAEMSRAATPDDVLLIFYSGHGFSDNRANFYLFPDDSNPWQYNWKRPPAQAVESAISARQLSEWLRLTSASEIVLIIDACQSSASIEGVGFKPGPLGDRGLGQLAYDKRMRVLAASQWDQAAIELGGRIADGVLTYALIHDGLRAGQASDATGTITLGALLKYAVGRVPKLLEEIRTEQLNDYGIPVEKTTVPAAVVGASRRNWAIQAPALYDFAAGKRPELVLEHN